MADGKNKPKPSGAFYRKRKIKQSKEDEKQSLKLKKYFCPSQLTTVQQLDNKSVSVDFTGEELPSSSSHQTVEPVSILTILLLFY